MTVAAMIEGLRAMEARNAALEAENAALRAQVSAAGGDPAAAPVLNADGLRACPFCGSYELRIVHGWYVRCRACDAYGPTQTADVDGPALWNTRR